MFFHGPGSRVQEEGDAPKDQKAAGAMVLPSPSGGQWYLGRTAVEINRYSISMVIIISYSGEGYLLAKALLEHHGSYQNPMETLHKPFVSPQFA